jgi:hypothetical protein
MAEERPRADCCFLIWCAAEHSPSLRAYRLGPLAAPGMFPGPSSCALWSRTPYGSLLASGRPRPASRNSTAVAGPYSLSVWNRP